MQILYLKCLVQISKCQCKCNMKCYDDMCMFAGASAAVKATACGTARECSYSRRWGYWPGLRSPHPLRSTTLPSDICPPLKASTGTGRGSPSPGPFLWPSRRFVYVLTDFSDDGSDVVLKLCQSNFKYLTQRRCEFGYVELTSRVILTSLTSDETL